MPTMPRSNRPLETHPKFLHPRYRTRIEVHGILAEKSTYQDSGKVLREKSTLSVWADKFLATVRTIRATLHRWWETIERMADEEEEWERQHREDTVHSDAERA